jgi:crossover junction endodeoxyribonuclease RuvC
MPIRTRPLRGEASDPWRRMTRVVIVLGIDPGLANTGYGVVQRRAPGHLVALDGGCVRTPTTSSPEERLRRIHDAVTSLIADHAPDAVALEALFFGVNAASALAVGQARGVAMLAAAQRGLPCHDYTPQQVKGAVCGSGRAAKEQVQRMVQTLLGLTELPRPDHAADALAVAICHANHAPLRAAKGRAAASAAAA